MANAGKRLAISHLLKYWCTATAVGAIALVFSVLALIVSDTGVSFRLGGLAWWMLYIGALAAERVWPFHRIDDVPPAVSATIT
jgi:hypothetical protein